MTEKKVDLTYIVNDSKRRATFNKRKSGLIKKVEEISVLCGIEACAIIYAPNEPQPEVWPSLCEAIKVISRFRRIPEVEQNKKMMTQEIFLNQRIKKTQKQIAKRSKDNRKKEMNNLIFQYLSTSVVMDNIEMNDFDDLLWMIDQNLDEINRKISKIEGQEGTANGEVSVNEEQAQVEVMKKQLHPMDNIINGSEGQQVQPFRDVANLQNGYYPALFNP